MWTGSIDLWTPLRASIHPLTIFPGSFCASRPLEGLGRGPSRCLPSLTLVSNEPRNDATAHFSFCRTLLEHTVSAESIPCHLPRTPGTSLTWHDSRSQRAAGDRPVKLLQQPGTEAPQVPTHCTHLRSCPPHDLTPPATPLPCRAGCTLSTMACTTRVPHWVA
nr:sterile alpha motif domain-containing protein 10 isoform X4 [Equus caballus]